MLKWFKVLYAVLSGGMIAGILKLKRRKMYPVPDELPSISVIIAARNEENSLPALINSLKSQTYPQDKVRFIIVDDESEDSTRLIAEDAAHSDKRFRSISTDLSTPIPSPKKRAVDTGIRSSESDWVITTDADCKPGPDWLISMSRYMQPEIGAVVGHVMLFGGKNILEWLSEGESWSSSALAASAIGLGLPFNAKGANFAFRQQLYLDLSGYGSTGRMVSGDDDLFLQRIVARTNWEIAYADDHASFVPSEVTSSHKVLKTKARHMSVGPKYSPGWVFVGAIGSLLFMGIGFASIIALFKPSIRTSVLKAWKAKALFDLGMIVAGYRVFGDIKRACLAFGAMSFAPFAMWIIWPNALFGNVSWKGREFKRGKANISDIRDDQDDPNDHHENGEK